MRSTRQWLRTFIHASAAVALTAGVAGAQAFISNGTVRLGVNALGHLNLNGGDPSGFGTTSTVGLRYVPNDFEATASGCECEGWGVGIAGGAGSGLGIGSRGYANDAAGTAGLGLVSFTSTASTAKSVTLAAGGKLKVTHDYKLSATPNMYLVEVTIENMTGGVLGAAGNTNGIVYRRVMDWDIEPTVFSEFVTLKGGTARYHGVTNPTGNLIGSGNDGFTTADALGSMGGVICSGAAMNADFTDVGACDHGAVFQFGFGSLAAGGRISFRTFYGAAATEAAMLAALGAVGAEAYSLAHCNPARHASCNITTGTPSTFAFGFAGIGGTPIEPGLVPEPSTYALLATGLVGVIGAARRRRNSK